MTKEKKVKSSNINIPLKIESDRDQALDFATKVYKKFDKMIKSIILFGSSTGSEAKKTSDIDLIILLDDVSIKWDEELVAWYRQEMAKIITSSNYKKELHINSIKLSTWWADLLKGDPVVLNVIRSGDSLIDFGGFFAPLKVLLIEGKIKATPEAIYTLLQRAPNHMNRARTSMLAAIDGLYWTMVDSAHAALISNKTMPPSPEHITIALKQEFVDKKMLDIRFVEYYRDLHTLAKQIIHGDLNSVTGKQLDEWTAKTDSFLMEMAKLVEKIIKEE